MSYPAHVRKKLLEKISLDGKDLYVQNQSKETFFEQQRSIGYRRNPKFMRYNTTYSRLLTLFFEMSEREQLRLLEYAKSIIDERMLLRKGPKDRRKVHTYLARDRRSGIADRRKNQNNNRSNLIQKNYITKDKKLGLRYTN